MPEHDQHQAKERVGQPDARDPAPAGAAAPHLADAAWQGAGLAHRTAQASRHALLLGAQHTHGNAWVARALAARQPAGEGAGAAAPEADPAATAGVIVGDDADPGPGQMSRSAFLDQLRSKAAEAAAEALEGTIWALTAGSGVDQWLQPYRDKDAGALEAAIKAKVPAASGMKDATAMIGAVCAEVRREVAERLAEEESDGAAGAGDEDAAPFSLADLPGAEAAAEVADILFQRRDDGAAPSADPLAVRRRLGRGRPLEGAVRSRMEPVLGEDLSAVRVHADGEGARVAGELGARAFATGRHVAFGEGEYAPGTPLGDALLAHELAHVAQQDGGATTAVAGEAALERDADASAAGAVASLWAPDHPLAARLQRRPRLRDGLALRSCSTEKKDKKPPAAPARAPTPEFKDEAMPADPKAVYDQKLPEAVNKLKVAFGRAEAETGKYDHDLWDKVRGTKTGEEALQLKAGIKPSVGMDAMFARLNEWSLDCAQFVQVAHLYALRWALGSTTFNNRVGAVRFLLRAEGDSTLLEGNTYWRRLDPRSPFRKYSGSKEEPVKDSADDLLTAAPTGSRVMWTNELAAPGTAFEHENTIKLGPNSFAAHGFGKQKIFGRRELERNLALIANKDADDAWIDAHVFIQLIEIYRTSENPTGQ